MVLYYTLLGLAWDVALKLTDETSYMIHGTVLSWFASYLHDCQQFVRCRSSTATQLYILYGVLQGLVLGPILFLLYMADLIKLVLARDLHPHLYADDTQIYSFCTSLFVCIEKTY